MSNQHAAVKGTKSEGRSQESGLRDSQGAAGAGRCLAGLGSQQAPAAPAPPARWDCTAEPSEHNFQGVNRDQFTRPVNSSSEVCCSC